MPLLLLNHRLGFERCKHMAEDVVDADNRQGSLIATVSTDLKNQQIPATAGGSAAGFCKALAPEASP